MIRGGKLAKAFGSFTAVDDVSFNVAEGEIFDFLGPNGARKMTTIRMLKGALFPLAGLPKAPAIATRLEPLTYGIDRMRGVLLRSARYKTTVDTVVWNSSCSLCAHIASRREAI